MPTVESVMASKAGPAISSAQAGQTTTQHATYTTPAAADTEDATLQIRLLKLPAQHRIVSLCLDTPDLDSGATGTIDVGVEDAEGATDDLTLFAAAQSIQAAAFNRYESKAIWDYAAVDYDRYIVVNVDVASTTGLAGTINACLVTRPELGSQFE
jgi:hypothetical protein